MTIEITKFMIEIVFWIYLGMVLGFCLLIAINTIESLFTKTKYWKETIQLAQEMQAIKAKEESES